MEFLTACEKRIYEYVSRTIAQNGYSPSIRDIQSALDIKSTSTVHLYLKRLEAAGYITKEGGKSRTLRVDGEAGALQNKIPVLGYIRAGSPTSAEQNFDGYVDFITPHGYSRQDLFALGVKGESMKEVGIIDGDTVIVNRTDYAENGDIVVALVEDEATVKTFYRENGHFRLQPQNKTMEPIILSEVKILGKVIASIRTY